MSERISIDGIGAVIRYRASREWRMGGPMNSKKFRRTGSMIQFDNLNQADPSLLHELGSNLGPIAAENHAFRSN
jgi:hypothetical protein